MASTAHGETVVRITATAEIGGTTEPCGCTADPLGDVARIRALAGGDVWVDAGSLLFSHGPLSTSTRRQALTKARLLGEIFGGSSGVGLGAEDLTAGPSAVTPPRLASNVSGLKTRPPQVLEVRGLKVGVFGVTSASLKSPGIKVTDPVAAARAAVSELGRKGAQVIVALLGMPRAEARQVLAGAPGIQFGIIGAEVGEGMAEGEPVGAALLVAPAEQGRRVAQLELHVTTPGAALAPFAGESHRRLQQARARRRIADLEVAIKGYERDPTADPAFVAQRRAELERLHRDEALLSHDKPRPPAGNYYTYALMPVKKTLPRDPGIAEKMRQAEEAIGRENLKAARSRRLPAPAPGQASYVGLSACAECHKVEVSQWRQTAHAHAWKTNVDVGKQYNYECARCHSTGLDRPGGATLATIEKRGLVDVQCEVCHGPGSIHVARDGKERPKTMSMPCESLCREACHTREHSDTFEFKAYLRDILGPGHGEKKLKALGPGPTGRELRQAAIKAAAEH